MWRLTAEGRQLLRKRASTYGGRKAFGLEAGIGKNQVKPILDDPEHSINASTKARLCDICPGFSEGRHFIGIDGSDACDIRLARDRFPERGLSRHDQRGIERLYEALLKNPAFRRLRPALVSLAESRRWFHLWGNASEDMPSERFFAYRIFRDKVIAFLYGEKLMRTAGNPSIFAIWYLVGTTNAFYDNSPVGLDADDNKLLPLGERESAVRLAIRLLEELRRDSDVQYLIFEVEAHDLARPDSTGRLLFRVYTHAEEEVREHFLYDRSRPSRRRSRP